MLQWVTTYYDVRAHLYGPDKENAIQAMDDDNKFDHWMANYDRQQKLKAAKGHNGGGASISYETYVANHAKVYKPEE